MLAENPDPPRSPQVQGRSACHPVILLLQFAVASAAITVAGLGLVYLMARPAARRTPDKAPVISNPSSDQRREVATDAEPVDEDDTFEEVRDKASSVPRGKRWVFELPPEQTEDEYARVLDAFRIELATPASASLLEYGSNFTGTPAHRTGSVLQERRMYTNWSSRARRKLDITLLSKAGVKVSDGGMVFQLHPQEVVTRLSLLEYDFKHRQPVEIRRTRFKVVPSGETFDFLVTSQEPLH